MTPTLQQLAALVPLDPTTLVLLTFALLPGRWTAPALRPALARPWWLRVPMFGLALLSLALPILPWPLIALINAYLFLEAFALATQPRSAKCMAISESARCLWVPPRNPPP